MKALVGFLQLQGLAIALLILAAFWVGRCVFVRGSFRHSLPMSAALFLGVNLFWIVRFALAGGGVGDT